MAAWLHGRVYGRTDCSPVWPYAPTLSQEALAMIDGVIETEASGNVTLGTVRAIAATGVTYVSVGALTHSVQALDISLNIETTP